MAQGVRHSVGAAVLVLLPPLVWVELKDWLQRGLDNRGATLPPELVQSADPQNLLWVLFGVTAMLLAVGAWGIWRGLRRHSTVSVPDVSADDGSGHEGALAPSGAGSAPPWQPGWRVWCALAVWALAWSGAVWAHWRQYENRVDLTVQQTQTFRLVGLQPLEASTRSVGGAKLFVEWPQRGLYSVVVESPSEALLRQPPEVTLSLAAGRRQGWFVLGWSVPGASGQ